MKLRDLDKDFFLICLCMKSRDGKKIFLHFFLLLLRSQQNLGHGSD